MTKYTQLVKPDTSVVAPPGYCLQAVQNSFSAPWSGSTATHGWELAQRKHPGEIPPLGIAVPLWFAMAGEPAGHVVDWMPDGSIYSVSDLDYQFDYHPNLQNLLDYYGGKLTLRGWSEDLNGFNVVEEKDMTVTRLEVDVIYRLTLGREPTKAVVDAAVGKKEFAEVYKTATESAEYKAKIKSSSEGKLVAKNHLPTALRSVFVEPNGFVEVTETLYRKQ